ncbi:LemA family protein [Candidatus Pacearchaeota archaeon]|nr:LemA family protein [Candidatus Pacearchaeota archaeon]
MSLIWIWATSVGIVALIVIMFVYYYNKFVTKGLRIDNSLAQIDVQLKKRADLVPNLIETVKGYAKHEKGIMEDVTKARKALLSAKDIPSKVRAGDQLQNALKSIFAIAENYPQLRANENFLQLQNELSAIEDKVAYARQYYNDTILDFNNSVKVFPGKFFASLYSVKERPFLEIAERERAVPKVSF